MLGKNLKRLPITGDGQKLFVKKIFRTLQGEGPYVGIPSVFIRLGGCNLACSFCDTEFENYHEIALPKIIESVKNLSVNNQNNDAINNSAKNSNNPSNSSIKLVVITGGEPFRQPIANLCQSLLDLDFQVQIETNGTLFREIPKAVDIVCSPKISNNKYLSIRKDLLPRITSFKFLISSNIHGYDIVPELGQAEYNIPVFVQAMDEYDSKINLANKKMAVNLAIDNNYRLSYQIHKDLGIE